MRRVVVTGIGIVSSIGNNKEEVADSLRHGRSGIEFVPEYVENGLRSHVHGSINIDLKAQVDRRTRRFMSDGPAYNYIAMREAIEDSGLDESQISNPRTGIIMGSGGASTENIILAIETLRARGVRRVGPYMVTRAMSSTASANLSTAFKIKGISYSVSSACATSAHCIGNASELIQLDKQDVVFSGGCDDLHWTMTALFDAMGALSSKFNDNAATASRPYCAKRDGFVISGGGGVVVLEELEHALKRGATIYAELVGYGASSDGDSMVQPSGDGAVRCMRSAIETVDVPIQYINAHGTSTPVGDISELESIREVFGSELPWISATKSTTGHALGAAGANEAIYTLLMMHHGFIAPTMNIEELEPAAASFPIVRDQAIELELDAALTNSFGFGGTNASLVFQQFPGN